MGDRNESLHSSRAVFLCSAHVLCLAMQAAQMAFPPRYCGHGAIAHMLRRPLFLSRGGGEEIHRHVSPIVDHLTSTFRSGVTTEYSCLNFACKNQRIFLFISTGTHCCEITLYLVLVGSSLKILKACGLLWTCACNSCSAESESSCCAIIPSGVTNSLRARCLGWEAQGNSNFNTFW